MKYKNINQYYVFQTAVSLLIALAAGAMWTLYFLKAPTLHGFNAPLFWAIFFTVLLPLAIRRQQRLYHRHTRKVLFMLDAIENNDTAIHFSETDGNEDSRLINRSLNRVARILYNVKSETAQQEKYYELILDCVNTGIVVLNDNGAIIKRTTKPCICSDWKYSPTSANCHVWTIILWIYSPPAVPVTNFRWHSATNAAQ